MAEPTLRRVLTFWPLVFYGLEVIVGAGIYVAIGAVMAHAGATAPLSFLFAGIAAAATGLCYAELASRFPEASGAVSYVRHCFGSNRLALVTAGLMIVSVAVAAASIARGAVSYLILLLPLPAPLLIILQVAGFTALAATGVRASVGLAALLGVVEIAGLVAATVAGLIAAPEYHLAGMIPADLAGWQGMVAGAFIAFFAFLGFETLANLAEETKDPHRTMPRGIIGALVASVVLYVAVATVMVLADRPVGNPLLSLFEGRGAATFAAVAAIAVSNGVLVEIITLARLFYGTACQGQLPAILAQVHPRTQTPLAATLLAGSIVLIAALLLPFDQLLAFTNAVTLALFVMVDLALWRLHRASRSGGTRMMPRWVPPVAAILCLSLLLAELFNQ